MGKLNDKIILLVGKSGLGKTTVADYLQEHYGYKVLQSYTTRPRRSEGDSDHIYITEEEYQALPNKVATTTFNGFHYCCTEDQINDADVYVIDPDGVDTLIQNYTGTKELVPILLGGSMELSLERMRKRGDSEDDCWSRLRHDEKVFKNFDCPNILLAHWSIPGIAQEIQWIVSGVRPYDC